MRYDDTDLKDAIAKNISWRQVCFDLGLKYAGGNVQNLKKKAAAKSFSTDHFLGKGWNLNGPCRHAIPLEQLLCLNSMVKPSALKRKLIAAGLKQDKCEDCGIPNLWNNKPLVLELDHVNGNGSDNRLENLRILCPNCHSQTPTFRGRKATVAKRQTRKS